MPKFRKKPVVIEAMPFSLQGHKELKEFMGAEELQVTANQQLIIHTLEGNMFASLGDWIIKGVNGEYYPCKPDIFEKTYEKVDE